MARRIPVVWRELLLATTCLVAASPAVYAASTVLPTGFSVAAGSGSASTSGSTMTIVQSTEKAIYNYTGYSISSGASVIYRQPNSSSIALNRVTGLGASQIDGSLTANGHIWLVNPNGVFIGGGAQINVGSFLATTAGIRDEDFLGGNYKFSGATGAPIVNEGEIRAASGGYVVLAGAQVRNTGLIQADLGTVQLAAGKSFALDLTGDKLIRFQVTEAVDMMPLDADGKPVDSLIGNSGTLSAAGGRVVLTARAAKNVVDNVINTTGIVEATSVAMVNGEIVLDGGENGTVRVAGSLDASGKQAGQTGGTVSVLGDKVALAGTASIDVSGDAGGGTALIGGAAHGAGPQQNASVTLVAGGAKITADALSSGDGGTVVLWSDQSTNLAGSISARGGALGGNGGFVETSSKGDLGIRSTALIDVGGPAGRGGQWLLDPSNVTIGDGSEGTIAASTISQSLNFGTNVTISTGLTGHQPGNITVNSAIEKTAGGDAVLTLNAANDITVNAGVGSTYNKLDVNLVAGGAVALNAVVATNGGNLTSSSGQFINHAAIYAGLGAVTINTTFDTTIGADITAGRFTANVDHPGQDFTLLVGATLTTGGSLTVSDLGGTLTIGGAIDAAGVDLQAASLVQMSSGTINAGSGILRIAADRIDLGGDVGSIRGTGQAFLAPVSDSTSIGLGTGGGEFRLSQSELNTLADFSSLTIGKQDGGGLSNYGSQNIHIGGPLSFALATTIAAGRGGAITLDPDAHVTALGGALSFVTGRDGSFTQRLGATIDARTGLLGIATDHISLGGAAGSISGTSAVSLAPVSDTASIGLGTAAGDFTLTQAELNTLTDFSHLIIGAQIPAIPGVGPLPGTSLITVGGSLALPIATTFAATAVDGTIRLNDGTALSSAGKAIDFAGGVVLAGGASSTTPTMVTIDTTNGGAAPAGAAITFQGTLDGTYGRQQSLTLTAGTGGDVTFQDRVGSNKGIGGEQSGVRLGDVAIRSARNINLAMAYGTRGNGFAANSFTVGRELEGGFAAGAASLTASSYINVDGANGSTALTPNGGAIKIDTTGDIVIAGNLSANGGSTTEHGGGNGGKIALVSGGNVVINTTDTPAQTGLNPSSFSISANGYDASSPGTAGNGGSVSISAADINLPLGVFARGGDALIAGSNGGRGGSITLDATGNVAIGSASSGTVAGASTRGGSSLTGQGGAGGDISITSRTMALTSIVARGGDTQAVSGGGNAGNILLTAGAPSGDAVTLFGVSDPNAGSTLSARGGRAGVTFTDGGTTGGTLDGTGGNITIQGGLGGATLNGTSVVRLATSTGTALGGGSLVSLTNSGGSSAGAITIAGPILASTDNGQGLRIGSQSGTVTVTGKIGDATHRVSSLILGGNSSETFGGPVTAGVLDLGAKTGGLVTFSGAVDLDALTTSANPYSIVFNGGTIGDPIFLNTGTLTFNGGMSVSGGLLADGPSATTLNGILASENNPIAIRHLVIGGDSAIVTGTAPVILGAVDQGAHSLVIAGGGNGLNADLFLGPWTGTGVRLVQPTTVGASVGLAGAAGDFTLDANSLHILASGGPSVVKIGRDDLSGALTANAFTFDAPLTLFGSTVTFNGALTKNSGDLAIHSAGSVNGLLGLAKTVTLAVNSGGNVQLQNANGLQLGNVSASGTLSLAADGTITQLAGTTVVAAGTTLAAGSGNDIVLTNAGNNFDAGGGGASLVVTSGANVQIADGNSLQLGNVTATGVLAVTASGDITQAAGTSVLAAGTTLTAGSGITLNNAGNDFDRGGGAATLTATGVNVNLTDANALQLGYIQSSGTASLTAGGNIGQAAGTGVFASATTLAAAGDIVLTNAGNNFGTLAVTRGVNAQLTNASALTGTLNLSGELAVSAPGAVFVASIAGGQSGAAAADHATTYAPLGAGPYTINGVTFPRPTAPPAAPVVVPPPTVQPTPPAPLAAPIADILPPPPAPPPVDTVLGGQAEAGAALANIAPAAGPGSDETDTGSSTPTDGDKLTDSLSKPLTSAPPSQPTGKKPSTTSVVINGMLSKFQPPSSATPPSGTTPSGQNFSSWGNEAFW